MSNTNESFLGTWSLIDKVKSTCRSTRAAFIQFNQLYIIIVLVMSCLAHGCWAENLPGCGEIVGNGDQYYCTDEKIHCLMCEENTFLAGRCTEDRGNSVCKPCEQGTHVQLDAHVKRMCDPIAPSILNITCQMVVTYSQDHYYCDKKGFVCLSCQEENTYLYNACDRDMGSSDCRACPPGQYQPKAPPHMAQACIPLPERRPPETEEVAPKTTDRPGNAGSAAEKMMLLPAVILSGLVLHILL